jgi:hypothetical protein
VPLAHFVELFSLPRKMQSSSPLSILKPKQIKAPSVLFPIARTSRSYPLQSADQAFFLASISTRPSKEQAADVRLGFSPLVFFLLSVSQQQAAVPSPLLQFTQEAIGTTNQCTHATSVNRPRVLFSLPWLLELLSRHPKNSIFCCCSPATPCSFRLAATSQQYFSFRKNQPPATSQQYFSLTTNQHQPLATSQTNRLQMRHGHETNLDPS